MSRPAHRSPTEAELAEHLRGKDRRITGQRRAILEVLREHPHPMTNKQVHAAMTGRACDLATIYRSMKLLVETGLVERFDFGDGVARFELAGHHSTDHHHHLICQTCDDVVEIEDCFVAELQRRISDQHGYAGVTHKLEFFGLCPDCQNRTDKEPISRRRKTRACGC
jgi:Fur family transcriptional regulator, ferric uptake regulator